MSRPVLLGIGGHVVGALVEQLGAVPGLAQAVDLHLSPALPGGRVPAAPEVLGRAVIVLEEAGALTPSERVALPPDAAIITLPLLEFESLWPLAAEHPPRDGLPAVPAPFGDRIALRVLHAGTAPANRRTAYDAVPFDTLVNLDNMHAFVAREMFRREQGCDIRVAAFVLTRFRQERLFHSAIHPAAPLLALVMAQILAHPALAALGAGSYDARLLAVIPGLDAVFADQQAPIHPTVAAHFGLVWWSPSLRYRQGDHTRSFSEWVDWHLREPASLNLPPLPVGPDLAALRAAGAVVQAAELHPATNVTRATPFFATPIDPAVAIQGATLLSPDAGHYTVPATLVALLPNVTVLGDTGAVLLNGQIVADTRPNQAPPPAATPRQRVEGHALLAYGPDWTADPHGMASVLPRLVTAARLRRQQPELRVLLPAAARAPWLDESLALLGLTHAITWLPAEPVSCAALAVTSQLDLADISPLAHQAAQAVAALVPLTPAGPRQLYLRSAQTAGRIANEPMIAATLAARGFTLVDVDRAPLTERIALLRQATAVVAPRGGALAEMVFCPAGAAVLELLGPQEPSSLYWSLASVSGLRYGYIVGTPDGGADPGTYVIPLAMLEQAAGLMVA